MPSSSPKTTTSVELTVVPDDPKRLANLSGQFDEHLRLIEKRLAVEISNRGNRFVIAGPETSAIACREVLSELYELTASEDVDPERVHLSLRANAHPGGAITGKDKDGAVIHTKRRAIRPRGANQVAYILSMRQRDLTFGIGPAGTGKTYLAVAAAVEALDRDQVRRIVLVRPAVEAGERLGFLPGDMSQKVDPYLRPMYDALYEMLGFERVGRLIDRNIIEVAPLAFMRGRTLNDSFVILDEAQNTTVEQMKMFLTRIGFGSRTVVTGDITQTDLPRGRKSGLRHAMRVLDGVSEVTFVQFKPVDVVRHPLVQRIVEAYARDQADAPDAVEDSEPET